MRVDALSRVHDDVPRLVAVDYKERGDFLVRLLFVMEFVSRLLLESEGGRERMKEATMVERSMTSRVHKRFHKRRIDFATEIRKGDRVGR